MDFENKRWLYFIHHAIDPMVKIGIATDYSRFKAINADYDCNWEKSHYYEGENIDIAELEKILHKCAHRHRLDEQKGTGKTEWFSTECLEYIVKALNFNVTNSNFVVDLKPNPIKLQRREKWREFCQPIFKHYPQHVVDQWLKLEKSVAKSAPRKMETLIPELILLPADVIEDLDECFTLRGDKFLSKELWKTMEVNVSRGISNKKKDCSCYPWCI